MAHEPETSPQPITSPGLAVQSEVLQDIIEASHCDRGHVAAAECLHTTSICCALNTEAGWGLGSRAGGCAGWRADVRAGDWACGWVIAGRLSFLYAWLEHASKK